MDRDIVENLHPDFVGWVQEIYVGDRGVAAVYRTPPSPADSTGIELLKKRSG